MTTLLIVLGLVVLGGAGYVTAAYLGRRGQGAEVVIDRAVLEERLAWLEEHYGLDQHKVFVEGTAIVAEQPEQHRPVQRG
jgi:hypothetical protein